MLEHFHISTFISNFRQSIIHCDLDQRGKTSNTNSIIKFSPTFRFWDTGLLNARKNLSFKDNLEISWYILVIFGYSRFFVKLFRNILSFFYCDILMQWWKYRNIPILWHIWLLLLEVPIRFGFWRSSRQLLSDWNWLQIWMHFREETTFLLINWTLFELSMLFSGIIQAWKKVWN